MNQKKRTVLALGVVGMIAAGAVAAGSGWRVMTSPNATSTNFL